MKDKTSPRPAPPDAPDRRGTSSLKWERYAGQEILPLWVADMDFASPPEVIAALHARVAHGVFGYTLAPPSLTEATRAWLERRHGWRVEAEWLVWLPGLVCGLNAVCRALLKPGEEALTFTPIYPPFLNAAEHAAGRTHRVPLAEADGRWEMDLEAAAAAITPETRLLLLCSPQNPTGRVYRREELAALAAFCARHDLLLCSDEIHADLLLAEGVRHTVTATLAPEIARRTITLMAPSKTFNLPGLGCSYAIVPDPQLRRRLQHAIHGIVPHPPLLGYTATEAAYRHGEPWLERLLTQLRANRTALGAALADHPTLRLGETEATYLAWIDARKLTQPAAAFEAAGLGLSDGVEFARPGFMRLNFACSPATLDEAIRRLRTPPLLG